MAIDIFSDRRAVQDRRRDGTTLSEIELCRRKEARARRAVGVFNSAWWLSTDYLETEALVLRCNLLKSL